MAYRRPHAAWSGLTFTIRRGDVFVIMGGSGSGKSTLLRHLVGLQRPAAGTIHLGGASFWDAGPGRAAGACSAASA